MIREEQPDGDPINWLVIEEGKETFSLIQCYTPGFPISWAMAELLQVVDTGSSKDNAAALSKCLQS